MEKTKRGFFPQRLLVVTSAPRPQRCQHPCLCCSHLTVTRCQVHVLMSRVNTSLCTISESAPPMNQILLPTSVAVWFARPGMPFGKGVLGFVSLAVLLSYTRTSL